MNKAPSGVIKINLGNVFWEEMKMWFLVKTIIFNKSLIRGIC